jgi:hypothetical protein
MHGSSEDSTKQSMVVKAIYSSHSLSRNNKCGPGKSFPRTIVDAKILTAQYSLSERNIWWPLNRKYDAKRMFSVPHLKKNLQLQIVLLKNPSQYKD